MQKEESYLIIDKEELSKIKPNNTININVGVLGHIDSGKTSIAKLLSTVLSTAALDKHPQSQERGITLDLGFSAFYTNIPNKFKPIKNQKYFQFTLVDCPGHASLIRTILGGAQIIDMMLLVIDINKGIQTQTAECILIAQLLMDRIIIILNKVDLINEQLLKKKTQGLKKIFDKTKFGAHVPMIPFSAIQKNEQKTQFYLQNFIQTLHQHVVLPNRKDTGPFLMFLDHCFQIKGKGTVITGTIVQGSIRPNQQIQIPSINQKKKIKSMQMFHKGVDKGIQGDRVGLLITQLEADKIQRGLIATPGFIQNINYAIIQIKKIPYFKFPILNKSKFHISSGHQNVMGQLRLFTGIEHPHQESKNGNFNHLEQQKQMKNQKQKKKSLFEGKQFEIMMSYEQYLKQLDQKKLHKDINKCFALIKFEKSLLSSLGQLIIGSKFDVKIEQDKCRLGFYGHILQILTQNDLKDKIKIYRWKTKKGIIDKVIDERNLIVKSLFSKQIDIKKYYLNKQIKILKTENYGTIVDTFGKSGKVKVFFKKGVGYSVLEGQPLSQISLIDQQVQVTYKKYYK